MPGREGAVIWAWHKPKAFSPVLQAEMTHPWRGQETKSKVGENGRKEEGREVKEGAYT